jgi:hypothetical protein
MRAAIVGVMLIGLVGCGKGYVIHTDIDAKGNKQKVVVTNEVDRNWAWFVGSDITTEWPMKCPVEAIGWKGELDKEQCTIDHDHLIGPNKGQVRYMRTVHASDTIGKKILPTLWMAALWGWLINSGGHGDQNVTQNASNSTTVNTHPHFIGKP